MNVATDQIGEVLGWRHSVRVEGFGYLQPDGKGEQTFFTEIMLTDRMMAFSRENPDDIQGFIAEMEHALRYFSNAI